LLKRSAPNQVGSRPSDTEIVPVEVSIPAGQPSIQLSSSELRSHLDGATPHRILLVSYYCPTKAHAGGLRILDMYALIKSQRPDAIIDLYTHHRPSIDWSLKEVHELFDHVYLSPSEDLTPGGLSQLRGATLVYDVIDLQFHQSAYQLDAYRPYARKILFTPMESQAKVLFLDMRSRYKSQGALRLIKMATAMRLASEEVHFCLKADEVVCVSRADAAFLRSVTSARTIKGLDTGISRFEFAEALSDGFTPELSASKALEIVYVAYFGSETNVVALRWFLDNVHPIIKSRVPGYVLKVVGRGDLSSFKKYDDGSVNFLGEVAVLAPNISTARVGIAPALGGSGFRGKVNQYAVLGVPSVVSPISFKGLAYRDAESIFVAEAPTDFAESCIRLLTDDNLNARMAQAARTLCLERYSWQSKWPSIRRIYSLGEDTPQ
jgi:glycosyltransferase involved in cell wall biosynthesis